MVSEDALHRKKGVRSVRLYPFFICQLSKLKITIPILFPVIYLKKINKNYLGIYGAILQKIRGGQGILFLY